jgi:hypothetical protein
MTEHGGRGGKRQINTIISGPELRTDWNISLCFIDRAL